MTFFTGQLAKPTQKWGSKNPKGQGCCRGRVVAEIPARLPPLPRLPAHPAGQLSSLIRQPQETKKESFGLTKKPQRDSAAHQPPRCERRPRQMAPREGRGGPAARGRPRSPCHGPARGAAGARRPAQRGKESASATRGHFCPWPQPGLPPALPARARPAPSPAATAGLAAAVAERVPRQAAPLAGQEAPRPPSVLPAGRRLRGRCPTERPPAAGTQMAGDGRRTGQPQRAAGQRATGSGGSSQQDRHS